MKKSLVLLVVVLGTLGCVGPQVEIPPAMVGKLNTPSGLQDTIIQPSKFRLPVCMAWAACTDLILAEASDWAVKEEMDVFMPKDQLNLHVEIRGTFAISPEAKNVNPLFGRLTARQMTEKDRASVHVVDRVKIIPMSQVYETYAQQGLREVVRSELVKYDIMQIMENRDAVGTVLMDAVNQRLKSTPIRALQLGLAALQPPAVIIEAQEAAKKREVEIQTAEAQKQIDLKRAEARYAVAVKNQEADLKEAETQTKVNAALARGVSAAWTTQRSLAVLEKMAESNNKVFILSEQVFKNPASLVGALQYTMQNSEVEPKAEYTPVTKEGKEATK